MRNVCASRWPARLAAPVIGALGLALLGAAPQASATPASVTQTFAYDGSVAEFTVPAGVTSLQIVTEGAGGGNGYGSGGIGGGNGGIGGQVSATVAVTPGEVLDIIPGGAGANGRASGGGDFGPGGTGGSAGIGNVTPLGGNGGDADEYISGGGGGGAGASVVLSKGTVLLAAGGGGGGGGGGGVVGYRGGDGGTADVSVDGGDGPGNGYAGSGAGHGSRGDGGASATAAGQRGGSAGSLSSAGGGGGGGGGWPRGGGGGTAGNLGGGGGGGGGAGATYAAPGRTVGVIYGRSAVQGGSSSAADGRVTVTYAEPPAATTTVVTLASRPAYFGQNVTVDIAVTSGGHAVPAGGFVGVGDYTVPVVCRNSPSGFAVLDAAGTATCVVGYLVTGGHVITAYYQGSGADFASSSGSVPVPVQDAPTTTTLNSSSDPSVTGQPVTLTARLSAAPSPYGVSPESEGTVTFRDGTAVLCEAVPVQNHVHTCSLPRGLPVGSHDVTATFSGSEGFAPSVGTLTQTVTPAGTTTVLTSSAPDGADLGAPVTFTTAVTAQSPGNGTPTGTVQYAVDGQPLGDPVALVGGSASSAAVTGLAPGSHALTASYSGDAGFAASSSTPLNQTVDPGAVTITGLYAGSLVVTQPTVLRGVTLNGPISVAAGATLAIDDSTINGPVRITGAGSVRICGTGLHGPLTVTGTTGPVVLGAAGAPTYAACAGDQTWGPVTISGNAGDVRLDLATVQGPVLVADNTGGTEIAGNRVGGPLTCTGNAPAPVDAGRANTVTGPRKGQCSAVGF
jgi:hypothetical protein